MTTIMQGDSYPIYIDLLQDGSPLKPHMIDDLAVYVGKSLSKTYSGVCLSLRRKNNDF